MASQLQENLAVKIFTECRNITKSRDDFRRVKCSIRIELLNYWWIYFAWYSDCV